MCPKIRPTGSTNSNPHFLCLPLYFSWIVVVAPSQLWDAARSSFFSIWPWKMISSALFPHPPSGIFRTQLDVLRFLSWINPKVTKSKEMGRTKVLKSVAKDYLHQGQVIKDFCIAIDGQTFFLAKKDTICLLSISRLNEKFSRCTFVGWNIFWAPIMSPM